MKVVDMHCDTIFEIGKSLYEGNNKELRDNNLNISLNKMKQSHYLLQNLALFTPLKEVKDPLDHVQMLLDVFHDEINKNKDMIDIVYSYGDIEKNEKEGKMSALLALEEGAVIHDNFAYLRNYYRLGVRMITLTWNYCTSIGFPNFEMTDKNRGYHTCDITHGLTNFGIEYVKECERLGIIIDVSHLSDAGFYDVLNNTTKPFVASHSNARGVCDHARNMNDDMIKALAKRRGVMGINFCADFLDEHSKISRVKDMVKHIQYIKDLAGIDCIGLGTDFDGIPQNLEIKDASMMHLLKDALFEEGFSQEEIEKIFYKNVLRVYKEVLK